MPGRRAFKPDVSFLEKLSMGAFAARKVFEVLKVKGLEPIELERQSMGYKIWRDIKIKRIRVPDILCLKTGVRVESRGKTKMEISMSHSKRQAERSWRYGLNPDDLIAFVPCKKKSDVPTDWSVEEPVHFFRVGDLMQAEASGLAYDSARKGVEEAAEVRKIWPSTTAKADSEVLDVDEDKIKLRKIGSKRSYQISLMKQGKRMQPLVKPSDHVRANQFIAAVVKPIEDPLLGQPVGADFYAEKLKSPDLSERYTAAKALGFIGEEGKRYSSELQKIVGTEAEHIYVRLEAAAALLRLGIESEVGFFHRVLQDHEEYRLEAIIVLSELKHDTSLKILLGVLNDRSQPLAIRAGAAWALGQLGREEAIASLIKCFNSEPQAIREAAARSVLKFGGTAFEDLLKELNYGIPDTQAGSAWVIAHLKEFDVRRLVESYTQDAKIWVAWIFGQRDIGEVEPIKKEVEAKNPEVYFAATVLWTVLSSWVRDLEPEP